MAAYALPALYAVLRGPTSVAPAYERLKLRLGLPFAAGGRAFYRLAVAIQ